MMKHKIGIILSHYYEKVSNCLLSGAVNYLTKHDHDYEIMRVPGAFEIPSVLKFAYNSKKFEGFVLLGCVIKGETNHYEFISQAIFNSILNLSITHDIPMGVGILTVNNIAQAMERADKQNKGGDAAEVCLRMVELKSRMSNHDFEKFIV